MIEWIKQHILYIILAIYMLIGVGAVVLAIITSVKNKRNYISEGTVINKCHTDEHTYYNPVIKHFTHVPEKYELKIKGEKNGKTVTYEFECTDDEYRQYKIGDHYKK